MCILCYLDNICQLIYPAINYLKLFEKMEKRHPQMKSNGLITVSTDKYGWPNWQETDQWIGYLNNEGARDQRSRVHFI